MLCVATQLPAADVDLATAQQAARSFLAKQVTNGRLNAPAATNLKLVKAEASVAKPSAVDYYIFNSSKSYVVVAGDDLAPQILMYGEEGSLDLNNIPPAMQWLLNKYKYQIDGIKAGTLEPLKLPRRATAAIPPMVTANWDQGEPYNNHAPTSGGTHAYTGCPATSLGMCFYKWKWPETYPALSALSVSGGLSCPALSERAADWGNIIDEYTGPTNYSYTSAQADAVAWLMRYVGQACNMEYSTSGSGATDPEIHQACLTFGYTDAQLLTLTEIVSSGWSYTNSAQNYTDAGWNNYMMNELQNGRPIEYLACDISGMSVSGHAFNVFGCNSNGQYYVNWGWSGDSNGYCTLHNFTTSTGSVGQSGSYVFKYGEAMIIGIEPPAGVLDIPRIKTDCTTLDISAIVGTPATATFTVTGYNLTDDVHLSLDGDNAFTLNTNSLSVDAVQNGVTVTVTYNPAEAGNDDATITLTSTDAENVTIKLNGTAALRKEAIVLQPAANVTGTSFKAVWTDETPAANVTSYTLWVNLEKPNDVKLLGSIDGNNYPNSYDYITLSAPWGGTNVKGGYNAVYISNSNSNGNITFTIPEGYRNDVFTVRITTVSGNYGSGNITVKSAQTAAVGHTFSAGETHTWLVAGKSGEKITITSTDASYSPDMAMIEVYSGDLSQQTNAPARMVAEEGDESYRIVTGITGKDYTVDDLTPEATYYFRVKAVYIDGTESSWTETKQVTLLADTSTPKISVTQKNVDFSNVTVGETATKTIQVSGVNLEGIVMLTLNDENGVFHLSNTTISASDAAAGKDVTVTFTPNDNVNYEATVTLASSNAQSVKVTLNGNGVYSTPVMLAADTTQVKHTSFRAEWTDETSAENVDSYTLMVNYVSPISEPEPVEQADMSGLEAVTNSEGYLTNQISNASQYLPDGWTVSNYLYIADSCIIIRENSPLTSAAFNLPDGTDKVTVVVDCEAFQANSTDIETGLTVSTNKGGGSQTQMLTNDRATYTYVLDASAANEQITFNPYTTSSRYYAYNVIYSIKIYAGDITAVNAPMYVATETGDSTYRVIEGITNKYYVVSDLIGGGTYTYKVKAIYANQSESEWSNEETVTLKDTPDEPEGLIGDLNRDGTVDIADVNICINIILEFNKDPDTRALADITGDGAVDISDVNALINIILAN